MKPSNPDAVEARQPMQRVDYVVAVGGLIRARREQLRLTLADVQTNSDGEFRSSVWGAYERGEREPGVGRLCRIAEFLRCPVAALLPENEYESDVPQRYAEMVALARQFIDDLAAVMTGPVPS